MSHGVAGHVADGACRTKLGEKIKENKTIKDLEMLTSKYLSFTEQKSTIYYIERLCFRTPPSFSLVCITCMLG